MKIGVIGAGSWGTTLAVVLAGNGHDVILWSWSDDDARCMRDTRTNPAYLPDVHLPATITVTRSLRYAVCGCDMIVNATPAQFVRSVFSAPECGACCPKALVNVTKGIEKGSLLRMSELFREILPHCDGSSYAVLSGPSHAEEVSTGKATTVVCASVDAGTTRLVQSAFGTEYFRIYGSTDVVGVELGGSLKNVISIGAGICDGAGFGDNTKAALITRGIAEMRRLGTVLGADPHTFAGLSGLGDLIVTTMSRHSRNRHVGEEIGRGRSLTEVLAGMTMVAEGVETTISAHALAQRAGVDMPITREVYNILFEGRDPVAATYELMTRETRDELW